MISSNISASQAARHPNAQALTRAVGAHEVLRLDASEFTLQDHDRLLLCSDGLYRSLSLRQLAQSLRLPTAQASIELLFNLALQGPAKDNLTAIVIRPTPATSPP